MESNAMAFVPMTIQDSTVQPFGLALVDYDMALMTGAQLARETKSLHPEFPVVMISNCAALPPSKRAYVNAYFGRGASFHDLVDTAHSKDFL
jgi:DNA-binding NarL/FixJ family response regulator